ncbi:hypothetical protein DPX16_20060 [Anabarilius grahami]|uniref:Uncharacterized protein n=1 Tax=Anabarilius grahami TaxID=495550 RepID=A0A3N0XSA2_ANAGA|nr:hypothetical protein DPX16_20060 [Anabarilius grahami]
MAVEGEEVKTSEPSQPLCPAYDKPLGVMEHASRSRLDSTMLSPAPQDACLFFRCELLTASSAVPLIWLPVMRQVCLFPAELRQASNCEAETNLFCACVWRLGWN